MKKFSDLAIAPITEGLVGDKIKIERILNREITVERALVKDSKFKKEYDKCLHMQILLGGNKHVVFSGSRILVETIEQVKPEDFPFQTTIVKEDSGRLEFR